MKQRVITASVGVLIITAIIILYLFFPITLSFAIAGVIAVGVHEILVATKLNKRPVIMVASIVFGVLTPFATKTQYTIALCFGYMLVLFITLIVYHKTVSFKDIAIALSMNIMITLSLTTIIYINNAGGEKHGIFFIFLSLSCSWFADIGGYIVGRFFGKHKLAPELSPKKTIEGVVGGVFFAGIFVFLLTYGYANLFAIETTFNYFLIVSMAIVCSFVSVVGDLSFSTIKRTYEIKDFGKILPGHGGVLDRFDSVIFVAPLVFLIVTSLPLIIN